MQLCDRSKPATSCQKLPKSKALHSPFQANSFVQHPKSRVWSESAEKSTKAKHQVRRSRCSEDLAVSVSKCTMSLEDNKYKSMAIANGQYKGYLVGKISYVCIWLRKCFVWLQNEDKFDEHRKCNYLKTFIATSLPVECWLSPEVSIIGSLFW